MDPGILLSYTEEETRDTDFGWEITTSALDKREYGAVSFNFAEKPML